MILKIWFCYNQISSFCDENQKKFYCQGTLADFWWNTILLIGHADRWYCKMRIIWTWMPEKTIVYADETLFFNRYDAEFRGDPQFLMENSASIYTVTQS